MRQHGRKGTAAVVLAAIDSNRGTRPAPPAELNEFEAAQWQRIVSANAADHFDRDTEQLLIALCRHMDTAARLDTELERMKALKRMTAKHWQQFDRAAKMRERETRAILALCRSMRITQQSINPDRAGTAKRKTQEKRAAQPWDG
jgi:Flp pilus assembly CpaE family ATPase